MEFEILSILSDENLAPVEFGVVELLDGGGSLLCLFKFNDATTLRKRIQGQKGL